MSRTKNAAGLCALLVEETYGELSARIYTLLLRRGRLTIPALVQYTRLPPRHLRHGLAVLIQQNLVYYHVESDSKTTHYEANHDASYFLLRFGKIVEFVHSQYGPPADKIVQNLLFMGHAKICDLEKACESEPCFDEVHVNGDGATNILSNGVQNGVGGHSQKSISENELDIVFLRLLESGILVPVGKRMFQSPSDTHHQVERELLSLHYGGSTKGIKQKDELKASVNARLRDIRSEGEAWQNKGAKRALDGGYVNGSEKRRKLANGDTDCGSHINHIRAETLERNLIVRINYEKCTVILRKHQLVSFAVHEFGETTSLIYAELLRLMENHIPRCQLDPVIDDPDNDNAGPAISTMELAKALSESIDPSIGIGELPERKEKKSGMGKFQKSRKRKFDNPDVIVEGEASSDENEDEKDGAEVVTEHGNILEVDQDSDSHGEDDFIDEFTNVPQVKPAVRATKVTFEDELPRPPPREDRKNRMTEIKNHLLLMAEHSPPFVIRCGSRGLGEWTTDFENLVNYMKEIQLDTVIFQSFGQIGSRIARILKQKGKLEEKQIQKFGLLKLKDVRTKLVEMQMAGFADVQEVPRDSSRAVARTMFLWFLDTERIRMIVLDRIYKTMARCLEVLKAEKHEHRSTIASAARSDVKGHEEEILTSQQLDTLRAIREKEEKVFTQIGRLDDLMGILRDF